MVPRGSYRKEFSTDIRKLVAFECKMRGERVTAFPIAISSLEN